MLRTASSEDTAVPFVEHWIEPAAWDCVYVIGDVHGCRDALDDLVATIGVDDDDLVLFVGDLVRKGPDGGSVVRFVRRHENMLAVRGNNEQKLLDGETSCPSVGPSERAYLRTLPDVIRWDGGLVVHGGLDPKREVSAHTRKALQTMRSPTGDGYDGPFWFERYEGPPRVFFGHTVLSHPIEDEWIVGLDTGCVYGGQLAAYELTNERFVTVEGQPHRERASDKIVSNWGSR
ncbi:metallophosphoesterase family protein [Halovivax cerinus]|uniref:Metallophosphoesterase family protein n=1 Tax=Halovivax cerinus TaxID=1487865 RepID=A0ABD5NJ15_9EURY|nr:metallophosphoesterase family protein [Halovivax cerinus]